MKNVIPKQKQINRIELVNFIKSIQGIKQSYQDAFLGKNFYFIGDEKDMPDFQIEFIPQSKNYFFTILVRGLKSEADNMHEEIYNYLQKMQLNRNIILDTETKQSLIN